EPEERFDRRPLVEREQPRLPGGPRLADDGTRLGLAPRRGEPAPDRLDHSARRRSQRLSALRDEGRLTAECLGEPGRVVAERPESAEKADGEADRATEPALAEQQLARRRVALAKPRHQLRLDRGLDERAGLVLVED